MMELEVLEDCGVRRINVGRVGQAEGLVLGGKGQLVFQ